MPTFHLHYLIITHYFIMTMILLYLFLVTSISPLLKDIALGFELVGRLLSHLTEHKTLKHFIPKPLRLNFFMLSILHFLENFSRSIQVQSSLSQQCSIIFALVSMLKFPWGCSKKEEYLNA
jgi:hypothetical protein